MNRRRTFALVAFLALVAFCSVILTFVPRIDLAAALLIGILPAGYDIWDQLFRRSPKSPE
ncbi:hypothetical protein ACIQUG_32995 [Ensifer sp. NPDC090286]|uniref:hypothetical protein n=1 Tax=Ensifer sp. NPDC090286 TaxID=3363991 RepID=UPI00383BC813